MQIMAIFITVKKKKKDMRRLNINLVKIEEIQKE